MNIECRISPSAALACALSILPLCGGCGSGGSSGSSTATMLEFQRDSAGDVHIVATDTSAVIRYTLDGLDPDIRAGVYLAPIPLAPGGRVRARAFTSDRRPISPLAEVQFDALTDASPLPATLIPCTQDRDWPIFDWTKRHFAVIEQVRKSRPELIFIGDSITHAFGGAPHDRPQPGQAVWERFYGRRAVANLGFGYDYVENVLWRLQNGEIDETQAKVVVLNVGTNNLEQDRPLDIVRGIDAVLEEIRLRQPQAEIVLMGIFPRGPSPGPVRERAAQVNELLALRQQRPRVTFVDLSAAFLIGNGELSRELMSDFLHPTARGYEIWAEALEPLIGRWLGDSR